MCERCGPGFTFFGLAEPQLAMLEGYAAALNAGWAPLDSIGSVADHLLAIQQTPADFLAGLADRIVGEPKVDGSTNPRQVTLTRWLWDGDFCGEIKLMYDLDGLDAATSDAPQPHVTCAVVASKLNHGYEARAFRQIAQELRQLGVPVPEQT